MNTGLNIKEKIMFGSTLRINQSNKGLKYGIDLVQRRIISMNSTSALIRKMQPTSF